ncbi:MAG: SDR family oxidoreductase [Exilibacterium sp.]
MEALGSEVLVLSADVADQQQMKKAIDTAQNTFGEIHGVIHAAGLPGAGMIHNRPKKVLMPYLPQKLREL